MVHEIALEPELVASWTSREAQAHVRDSVGIGNPRVVSGFPSIAAWREAVLKAAGTLEPIAQARFEAFVQHVSTYSTYRKDAKFDQAQQWVANAVKEHGRIPFSGIICRQQTAAETSSEDVIWDNAAPWNVQRGYSVPRQSAEYARFLSPMVRLARAITIVDPHFTPTEERFVASLEALLKEALKWRRDEAQNLAAALLTTNDSTPALFQQLARRLPQGLRLKIVRYEAREEKDHNRYVITELGGVSFGTGVDEGSPRETDDLLLLAPDVLAFRSRQYVQRTEGFRFDPITTVVGTKRLV
jgi:hypothetical protein